MRLDKFLKVSRIIKRRTLSKEISQSERVKVNGKVAKPSTKLNVGDLIEIEIKRKGKRVAVSIADNGCGISEKDLERIGELFYTTKKGGSGVGIFMCKRIVEQNGGKFKIAHNKPKGTKVTVELNTAS